MDKDSKFTRDDDGNIAVRVVTATEGTPVDKDWMFTRDTDGNIAVRVVNGAGSGGDQHNMGYFATPEALRTAYPTANPGDFAIVESTDTVWVWDADTSAWKDGDTKGQVTSVNNQTGAVTLDINDVAPTQTNKSGYVLGTDGFVAGWVKPEIVQRSTMPQASEDELGNVYQFVGTTDANYTNGYFYKCVSDGQSPATYSWTQTNVQPTPSELPSQTGQSGKFLTTDGTDASWSDKPLVNTATNPALALTICGNSAPYTYATNVGAGSIASSSYTTALGTNAAATGYGSIQIGGGTCSGVYSIHLGPGTVTEDQAFVIGFYNQGQIQNFKMLDYSGTIPTDRFTTTPVADGSYVPTLTISSGTATRSWAPAASAPVVPSTMPTLAVADWSSNTQTVNVTGVTASNVVFVSPAPASAADYASAGIVCTAQAAGTLTFTCTTVPSNAITVNVVILG